MTIVLASNNVHKAVEFNRIFSGHTMILPKDMDIDFDYEETGVTFQENALGKAMALYSRVKRPVIADDSGLCVDALGGKPGVYSARYGASPGGTQISSSEKNELLLSQMITIQHRQAFFVCCMVLVIEEYRFFIAQETVRGEITQHQRGVKGFGYDPVFFVPEKGMTVAEMEDHEKDEISHRG
ncbi:MAG: RdgB/HAM1 family non-canonical purine NTP pyrophosphatase, partial [Spirochaetales bacterium]|nr:RdgB/HAM1 family non-canonical purine NTP pyrophosphatase [Spirochaetales bacterium]